MVGRVDSDLSQEGGGCNVVHLGELGIGEEHLVQELVHVQRVEGEVREFGGVCQSDV